MMNVANRRVLVRARRFRLAKQHAAAEALATYARFTGSLPVAKCGCCRGTGAAPDGDECQFCAGDGEVWATQAAADAAQALRDRLDLQRLDHVRRALLVNLYEVNKAQRTNPAVAQQELRSEEIALAQHLRMLDSEEEDVRFRLAGREPRPN